MELLIIQNSKENTFTLSVKTDNPFNPSPGFDVLLSKELTEKEFNTIMKKVAKDEMSDEAIYISQSVGGEYKSHITEYRIKSKYIIQ